MTILHYITVSVLLTASTIAAAKDRVDLQATVAPGETPHLYVEVKAVPKGAYIREAGDLKPDAKYDLGPVACGYAERHFEVWTGALSGARWVNGFFTVEVPGRVAGAAQFHSRRVTGTYRAWHHKGDDFFVALNVACAASAERMSPQLGAIVEHASLIGGGGTDGGGKVLNNASLHIDNGGLYFEKDGFGWWRPCGSTNLVWIPLSAIVRVVPGTGCACGSLGWVKSYVIYWND